MEFKASHRYAKISPRKARLVMDMVRGKPINAALDILRFSPKRASVMIDKVVRSAMANASMDRDVNVNQLVLSEARVDEGPLAQGRVRYRFRSRGGVVPIRKRTCHMWVKLAPVVKGPQQPSGKPAATGEKAAAPTEEAGATATVAKKKTTKKKATKKKATAKKTTKKTTQKKSEGSKKQSESDK